MTAQVDVATGPRPVTPAGILAASLAALDRRLDDLDVPADVRADVRRARELAEGLEPYVGRVSTPESPALAELVRRTDAHPWAGALEREMLSGHVEGQLLKALVRATGAVDVLEIGMFTGYSALAMAEALPAGGRVVACEVDADVAAFAQQCFAESPAGARVDVRVGPALDTLQALGFDGVTFDLVFVDADKAGYADYLTTVLDRGLLAPRGLLVVDNTLMQGEPWLPVTGNRPRSANGEAIAAFNEALAAEPRVEQVVLPVRDGVTLAWQI